MEDPNNRQEVDVTRRRTGDGGPRERAEAPRRQRDQPPGSGGGGGSGGGVGGGLGAPGGGSQLPIGDIIALLLRLPKTHPGRRRVARMLCRRSLRRPGRSRLGLADRVECASHGRIPGAAGAANRHDRATADVGAAHNGSRTARHDDAFARRGRASNRRVLSGVQMAGDAVPGCQRPGPRSGYLYGPE